MGHICQPQVHQGRCSHTTSHISTHSVTLLLGSKTVKMNPRFIRVARSPPLKGTDFLSNGTVLVTHTTQSVNQIQHVSTIIGWLSSRDTSKGPTALTIRVTTSLISAAENAMTPYSAYPTQKSNDTANSTRAAGKTLLFIAHTTPIFPL